MRECRRTEGNDGETTDMNADHLLATIANGESKTLEFKKAQRKLPQSLYETICAFLNRDGGAVVLGVTDDGRINGVDRDAVNKMKGDFANTINNPQALNPPCYLTLEAVEIDGAVLLHVYIPPGSQVHRFKGRIFDRNEDGDFDITDNQSAVGDLYRRKLSGYSENLIFPHATMADLRPDLIERVRRMAASLQGAHPWATMSDMELLSSAQLWKRDFQKGLEGITLAGILLFGKDETILSVLPHHRTDAVLRRVKLDRYDDRDDIRTNLIESFDRLVAFGEKHLPDPFFLEGGERKSLRGIILREIIANLLIHREYTNAFPAKFIIEKDRIFTENSSRPHGFGAIKPLHFSPFPKNPAIGRVFKEIGRADELGSGVRNLYRYTHQYTGHDPHLIEGDIFQLIVPFTSRAKVGGDDSAPHEYPTGEDDWTFDDDPLQGIQVREEGVPFRPSPREWAKQQEPQPLKKRQKRAREILRMARENPKVTIAELASVLAVTDRTIERNLKQLQQEGRLQRIGPAKGGHWEVLQ